MSSSNIPASPESEQNKEDEEETIIEDLVEDRESLKWLTVFFGDVCPSVVFKMHSCKAAQCAYSTHEMPEAEYFRKRLLANTKTECELVYKFVCKFPLILRQRYLPMLADVWAQRKKTKSLMEMVKDLQGLVQGSNINGMDMIVKALVKSGSTKDDAIQLIIDNHIASEKTREEIIEIIGTSGASVMKFLDYLNKNE